MANTTTSPVCKVKVTGNTETLFPCKSLSLAISKGIVRLTPINIYPITSPKLVTYIVKPETNVDGFIFQYCPYCGIYIKAQYYV